jgi:hypothetical protein
MQIFNIFINYFTLSIFLEYLSDLTIDKLHVVLMLRSLHKMMNGLVSLPT